MDRRQVPVEYVPGEIVSTASNREDVLLWRAFRGKKGGFYIDIGAGNPNNDSLTRWLYCNEWRGINIEPHPDLFPGFSQWRPRDINLNCAVSNRKGRFTFYKGVANEVNRGWGLSSLNPQSAERARTGGIEFQEISVETATLAEIVDQYCSDIEVDILKIDVENHEEAVIQSADWTRFRPKVLCIESTLPMSATPSFHQWEYLLIEAGYTFALFDGFNNFYVRRESPEILSQFNCGVSCADRWRPAAQEDFQESGHSVSAEPTSNGTLADPQSHHDFASETAAPLHSRGGGVLTEEQHSIDEVLVRCGYRALLGREPENDAVVRQIATAGDPGAILQTFVDSAEFKARFETFLSAICSGFNAPRLPIETVVSPEILQRLFERIRAQWKELGEREPYWSVLSMDNYLRANYDTNQSAFKESGRADAAMVDYLPSRNGIHTTGGTCLELGCGVGRVTRFLAERFERVIAIDISPGNLKLAQEYLEESGVTNVTFHLIADPGEIAHLEGFDFFYSTIVLQHNPPPVQRFILESVFRALRSGGCVLFQIPTFEQDYGFSAEPYLRSPVPRMEMHALPMSVIFALFDACGLSCKEVVMDSATGHYGSHTFVAQKN